MIGESPLSMLVLFFVYGLAFFSMGLATLLEAGQSPLLAEARVLRPLGVFGLSHGIHEWLEVFIMQGGWLGLEIPEQICWFRLGLLLLSFSSLIAFGVQVFRPPRGLAAVDAYVGIGMLGIYLLFVYLSGATPWEHPSTWVDEADALARHVLAVPGALLAVLALRHHSGQVKVTKQQEIRVSLNVTAAGFAIYAVTQLFGPPVDSFPARYLNTEVFKQITGVPIQVVRTLMAGIITFGLVRATKVVEDERQMRLLNAQRARVDALERVQEEMVKREALRRELLRRTVIAQEEERVRISRELHDETAQLLTAFRVNLAALENRLPKQPEASRIFRRLHSLSDKMATGIYRLIHDLHPAQLDDLGLAPALSFLTDEVRQNMDLDVTLQVKGTPRRLEPLVETVLFRIAKEALTNVVRHAQVLQAEVRLTFNQNSVALQVRDKGVGFDFAPEAPPGSLGLAVMRERADSVGGRFEVHSSNGSGTIVDVVVPLSPQGRVPQER